ncbi:DNA polymerase III subunit epsilon [Rhodovibrio sodomensis]|uniref:DNA-directed DNA polymerase n=1 Tax=Rhodovibrio sodomensis TaxID=1088 RepID=A0ABS1DHQ5_9PROT|nr:3'-5' exonuclease [Rhodovibrio sodomensis]MBK1669048.1 DNA polymerase III subunit epsilon [Rhodovibrio sodomensis]
MPPRIGLRVRIFLLFALLAGAILAALAVGLVLGYRYAGQSDTLNGFVAAGVVAGFAVLGLTVLVWLLFDENVAKPVQRLASQMRARAHAGAGQVADLNARYLGDLGPAAQALAERLGGEQAGGVDAATARLQAEREWLTALLSEIPIAVVLVSQSGRIVLYDAQASVVLAQIAPPRLGAPIVDYLDRTALDAARRDASETGGEVAFDAPGTRGEVSVRVRLKPLARGFGEMLILEQPAAGLSPSAARPLVFDFELLERQGAGTLADRPLGDIPFVVFDTETTGLEPARDELVQIAAVRVVNGRTIAAETMDTLVDPGRRIPKQASRVHGITDDQVADAPSIQEAVARLHGFARDAVLVAHNAPFDLAFLKRQEAAIGASFDHPVLDTVLLSAVLFGTNEAHSLDALCARLGIEIPADRRHTAMGDAEATAAALCAMIPMLRGRGFTTLQEVLRETRRYGRLLRDLNA